MKKKFIVIAEILCLVLLVGGALFLHFRGSEVVSFSGTLMYGEPNIVFLEQNQTREVPIEPVYEKDGTILLRDNVFFGSKSKILMERESGKIELFDVETNEFTTVYKVENSTESQHEFAYVDENHFSIVDDNTLLLIDIITGEKKIIAEDVHQYTNVSWTSDGRNVYYVSSFKYNEDGMNKICRISIDTGEKEVLCEGNAVVCSADGKYFAYEGYKRGIFKKYRLFVRDVKEGTEWKFDIPTYDYCFSPDGGTLALICEWRGFGTEISKQTLRIWDFKNDKSQILLEDIPAWNIDWIE